MSSLRTLDRSRPAGEVYGVPRIRFLQDGVAFDPQGNEVTDFTPEVEDLPDTFPDNPDEERTIAHIGASEPVAHETTVATDPEKDEFETMHWKTLKVMVETFGGVWTNRADGIAFMRGRT